MTGAILWWAGKSTACLAVGLITWAVLRRASASDVGLRLFVTKGLPLAGGQGGSAASAVAGAVATNRLLGSPLTDVELLECALEAEATVSGRHADNLAPALYGGICLVRSVAPMDIVPLPIPDGLHVVLAHPDQRMNTAEARAISEEASQAVADVATNYDTQFLRFSAKRLDMRILCTVTRGLYHLVARRSAGINSVKDLRGKRVATQPRTSSAFYLAKELEVNGLSESDVAIVRLAPIFEITKALVEKRVDAICIWEPASQAALDTLGADQGEKLCRSRP